MAPSSPPPAFHCRHFVRNPMCRPLPANLKVSPNSTRWVAEQSQPGAPLVFSNLHVAPDADAGDRNDSTKPLYADAGVASIPHVIHCAGVSYSRYICDRFRTSDLRVRIPRGATPSSNSDHHLSIEDDAAEREIDFWGASVPSDVPNSLFDVLTAGQCPYDGDGTNCSGATATDIATSLGEIVPADVVRALDDPHGSLPYALSTALLCASPTWVYPAVYSDGANTNDTPACKNGLGPDGRPPEGVRFFLDLSDAEIDATANAPYVKVLLRTLDREHFGGTVVDTNWSKAPGPAFSPLRTGWDALVRAAGRASGAKDLTITNAGIDLATKLKFCTNGTCE